MTDTTDAIVEAIKDCGPIGCCNIGDKEAREILSAVLTMLREDVERAHRTAQYDPAPYTKGKAAIRARIDAMAKEINP